MHGGAHARGQSSDNRGHFGRSPTHGRRCPTAPGAPSCTPLDLPIPDPPSFPVANALHILSLVERFGVGRRDLLAGADIPGELLGAPNARLPVSAMTRLLERARVLTRQPALGLHIGLDIRPTVYGNLGFALMSASSVREAIEVAVRFGPIITTALRLRLRVEGRTASVILDEEADFGSVRDIIVIATLVSLRQVGVLLAAACVNTTVVELALPEPPYAAELAAANLPMRFDAPAHRLVFDARSLDVPYTMANPTALSIASDHCQRELERIGRPARQVDAVRRLLARADDRCESLEDVAAALHQSARTLKRHLAAEGASFSALRNDELRDRAIILVRSSKLTLAQIADRLGYAHVTSFERAFHRWTSTTPSECRRAASRTAPPPRPPAYSRNAGSSAK
jgi:AraC-like DNA-binding protein